MSERADIVIGLTAVIVALEADKALTLVVRDTPGGLASLPFGPFDPGAHRTFELALRAFVRDQTGAELGYVEQLYTFGDRGREAPLAHFADDAGRVVSVSYLALAPEPVAAPGGAWSDWYAFFPWEDWRGGRPAVIDDRIAPGLASWAASAGGQGLRAARRDRAGAAFGLAGAEWNEERVLDRYELLYEAGLAPEADQDHLLAAGDAPPPLTSDAAGLGRPMASDHRRILATAIARLRAKIKYRPILFEVVPELFTLSALQTASETILGLRLHKQNFRRALAASGLVEGSGVMQTATGGRPAELHRFRREALRQRPALGVPAPRLREG